MKSKYFYIVDVFAEKKYSGNQLAVFTNGEVFSDEEMQKIASEINFSETTFYFSTQSNREKHRVRIFTPEKEIPFAGHPTLGTAYVIQKYALKKRVDKITLDLNAGKVPVRFSFSNDGGIEKLVMKQLQPEFVKVVDLNDVADALSIDPNDIDNRFPCEEVSTGIPFLIVPIKSLEVIQQIKISPVKFEKFSSKNHIDGVLVFSRQTCNDKNDLHIRVFCPGYRIIEDAATGSANGTLIAYLLKHKIFGRKFSLRAEQGFEMGRNSILFLDGELRKNEYIIEVGGKVVTIAKGEWIA